MTAATDGPILSTVDRQRRLECVASSRRDRRGSGRSGRDCSDRPPDRACRRCARECLPRGCTALLRASEVAAILADARDRPNGVTRGAMVADGDGEIARSRREISARCRASRTVLILRRCCRAPLPGRRNLRSLRRGGGSTATGGAQTVLPRRPSASLPARRRLSAATFVARCPGFQCSNDATCRTRNESFQTRRTRARFRVRR